MRVIMLMYDSLNRHYLEPYGATQVKTPNFQRLAKHSVQFEKNYAGSLPCMPARRELHTGRYNFLHRSWGPIEPYDDSMPEILKNMGIITHLISDHTHYWEDGGATYHGRYSSWENIRGQEGDMWKVTPASFRKEKNIQNNDGKYFLMSGKLQHQDSINRTFYTKEEEMPLARTFSAGLDFLEKNHREDNWFLQIECFDPHEPFFAAERYYKLYDDNYTGNVFDWPPYHQVTEDDKTKEHLKKQYAALLSMCDSYLGTLLDAMDRYDMWKDTMLIVNTDHGYLLGEHGWWSKGCMPWYEELVHTPLFIHIPELSEADGSRCDDLTQTIDLPATILDYFGIEKPKDMQGHSILSLIKTKESIRDYALFGVHGGHINICDGRYVYMKAPTSHKNQPLYEYTLMPMHMRSLFGKEELEKASIAPPFSFTKNCPVLKIPKEGGISGTDFADLLTGSGNRERAQHIDNNSLTDAANFGDLLFDLEADPNEAAPIENVKEELRMARLLIRAMVENDAPEEQFVRLGLPVGREVTEEDIKQLHKIREKAFTPPVVPEYIWEKSAVQTFHALMQFVPQGKKEEASVKLEREIRENNQQPVTYDEILSMIPLVIEKDFQNMVYYFVSLSGRTL